MRLTIFKVSDARRPGLVHNVVERDRRTQNVLACTDIELIWAPQPAFPYVSKNTATTCLECIAVAERLRDG